MSPAQHVSSPFFPPLYSVGLCELCGRPAGGGEPDRRGKPMCAQCAAEEAEYNQQATLVQTFVDETLHPLLRLEFARFLKAQEFSTVNNMPWLLAEELVRQRDLLEEDFTEVARAAR